MSIQLQPKIDASLIPTDNTQQVSSKDLGGRKTPGFRLSKQVVVTAASTSFDTGLDVPKNGVVEGCVVQAVTALTESGATNIDVGVSGDLDAYFTTAKGNIDAVGDQLNQVPSAILQPVAADASVLISSTNGSGTQAGTFSGTYNIFVYGYIAPEFEALS